MADVVTRHALWLTSFKAQRLEDDNFGDTPFKHSPPDASFVSVQSFASLKSQ